MAIEKRQFLYGMDFDSEERFIQPGFTRKNLNVQIGTPDNGASGTATNTKGNTLIPNVELPAGDNKVIGAYWYALKDRNYIFIWNSEGNHGIYEYDNVPSQIRTVMIAPAFNFEADKLITGINVVELDEDNDLLYWASRGYEPRKINIDKAKAGAYSTPIQQEIFDAIKYPPLCPPTGEYGNDSTRAANLLKDKLWQFKARYGYDDKENSAFSPISKQILPSSLCSGGEADFGNYIEIKVPVGGELVTHLEIAAREGNLGDFKKIIRKPVSDFTIVGGFYIYRFYNDGNYSNVDLQESNKLFDNVPLEAGAQEYIEGNRIVYADITEGYDNVDVDAELELSFPEESNVALNTIKGSLRIVNPFSRDVKYDRYQPIYVNDSGVTVWGGFDKTGSNRPPEQYQQILPLNGFVLYLAGTNHYAISKQIIGNNSQDQDESTGVYLQGTDISTIRTEIEGTSAGNSFGQNGDSRVWSTFQIDNVPDGTYILRVASHLTEEADLIDQSYQKTSTNTVNVASNIGFERTITVSGGQILELPNTEIMDLIDPDTGVSGSQTGYAVENVSSPQSIEELLASDRITRSRVYFSGSFTGYNAKYDQYPDLLDWRNRFARTDHNGYFFIAADSAIITLDSGTKIKSGAFEDSATWYNYSDTGMPPVANPASAERLIVLENNDPSVTSYSRDSFSLTVYDSDGNRLPGVNIIQQGGETFTSDSNGLVEGVIYADTDNQTGAFALTTTRLFPYLSNYCNATFAPLEYQYSENIGQGFRNITLTPISFQDLIASVTASISNSFLRRGGDYKHGIVYYDRGNRSGLTNTNNNLFLHIPFYTEQYNGSLPEPTTPVLGWQIKNLPPSWATHYQWVRTKDSSVNRYLQWASDSVTELDNTLEIDISNITDFSDVYPNSLVSYDFTTGDRIRLIGYISGNRFTSYYDLSVLGFDSGTSILTIEKTNDLPNLQGGVWFEIYTPKLLEEEDLYYEIGECFEIKEVQNAAGDLVKVHAGPTQDQDPDSPSLIPATGVFTSGDSYYRERTIPLQGFKNFKINDASFSDFWSSKVSDIGRINIEDVDYGQIRRWSTIYYSERFQPETNINGLNSFYDTSFETYDRKYGPIRKLYSQDKRLDSYQELKVGKILIEENVIFDQFDQGNVASSEKVLSKIIYYAGEYGTLNPESFAAYNGRRYFFDIRNGVVLRLSNDGLTPISENKMIEYFESKSNFYSAFDLIPEIWGTFDVDNDQYIISFGEVSRDEGFTPDELELVSSQAETVTEIRDGLEYTFVITYSENEDGVPTVFTIIRDIENGTYVIQSNAGDISLDRQKILTIPAETLSFSELTGHWVSFWSYTPECMVRAGITFLSFKNGRTFLHGSNNLCNNFYGVRYESEVWVVFNQEPSNVKVFNALSEESDTIWEAKEIITQAGQRTYLDAEDFQDDQGQGLVFDAKETIHYAALWQDVNSDVDNALIEGDDMRDKSILVKLSKDTDDFERLFAVNIEYKLSYLSNS